MLNSPRFLLLVVGFSFLYHGPAVAWSTIGSFQTPDGLSLAYLIAAPQAPGASGAVKYPILIFEEGDGTASLMQNDVFDPSVMASRMERASQASGFVWAVPQLRRQYYAGQELAICRLDFLHRQNDLEAFIDQAKQLPYVDASKIFLMGHSAGADTVTHTAQDRSDIRGTINLAGGVSSCSEEQDGADCPPGLQTLEQYQCSSSSDSGRIGIWWRQLFMESNLLQRISSMGTPYLALIGSQDTVVSVADFQKYSAQILASRHNFQASVLQGLDHGTIVTSAQALGLVIQFVQQTSRSLGSPTANPNLKALKCK